jgi:hypothetical protein
VVVWLARPPPPPPHPGHVNATTTPDGVVVAAYFVIHSVCYESLCFLGDSCGLSTVFLVIHPVNQRGFSF